MAEAVYNAILIIYKKRHGAELKSSLTPKRCRSCLCRQTRPFTGEISFLRWN